MTMTGYALTTCSRCQAELAEVEREVSDLGGPPLCDSCRDRHYYETDGGQLELIQASHAREIDKLNELVYELKAGVHNAESRELEQHRIDQARIDELEARVGCLKLELEQRVGPFGARSRPSSLA